MHRCAHPCRASTGAILLLASTGLFGCEENLAPREHFETPFSLYGVLSPDLDTQSIRLYPLEAFPTLGSPERLDVEGEDIRTLKPAFEYAVSKPRCPRLHYNISYQEKERRVEQGWQVNLNLVENGFGFIGGGYRVTKSLFPSREAVEYACFVYAL